MILFDKVLTKDKKNDIIAMVKQDSLGFCAVFYR